MVSLWTLNIVLLHVGLAFSWHYEHLKSDDVEAAVRREQAQQEPRDLSELTSQVSSLARLLAETREELDATKRQSARMQREIERLSAGHVPGTELKCETRYTFWYDTVGKTMEYLDQFNVNCHHNEFLRQWRMSWGNRGTRKQVRFVCCKYTSVQRHPHHHGRGHQPPAGGAGDQQDSSNQNDNPRHRHHQHGSGQQRQDDTASPEPAESR